MSSWARRREGYELISGDQHRAPPTSSKAMPTLTMRRNPGACGAERWYCGACPAGSWSLNIDGTRCPAAPTDRDPPQCLTCPGRTYQRCRLINHSALQPLGLTLPGSCEVVYSLFSQPEDLNHLDSLLPPHCNLVLYDRRPGDAACTGIPRRLMQNRNATCTRLDNEYGADATHTWVHHVATAYHRLPDFVIFLGRLAARNSWQHLRASCRASSFGASKDSFACARPMDSCDGFSPELTITSTHSLSSWVNKTLPQYYKEAIRPATVRPFGRWLEHYLVRLHAVDRQPPLRERLWRAPLCHYSVFATTRFNLHAHPREVYHQINGSLSVGRSEGNWYIEWGVSAIFGAGRGLVIS